MSTSQSIPHKQSISIRQATTDEDLDNVRTLFNAYTTWLDLDISFQNYASELASIPGSYALSKGGALLLARRISSSVNNEQEDEGDILGVIALRSISISQAHVSPHRPASQRTCEVKRLYVLPSARGIGVAKKLVAEVVRIADEAGYDEMLLDTLDRMAEAKKLYEAMGFVQTQPYYLNPLDGVAYYSKTLHKPKAEGV